MSELSLGVVATSRKPDERRLPLHPDHLDRIEEGLRSRIRLEHGYGQRFGVSDADLAPQVGGFAARDELLAESDVVLLAKPAAADLEQMHPGQVLWGWPHCVQDVAMAQAAIDHELTLIAWEAMNHWSPDGSYELHVFHQNNELAGYCSVLHALALLGRTGDYGRRESAAVISYGATARGAVRALTALGVRDVTVLTQRDVNLVASPDPSVTMRSFARRDAGTVVLTEDDGEQPMAEVLGAHDLTVNCVLQDPVDPLMFVTADELHHFVPGSVVVDVSCDEGMGFSWAAPTTFAAPLRTVGDGVHYYAVDHSPSHLWDAATWEISEALLPYLPAVLAGPEAWEADDTLRRAIEIARGRVRNPRVLEFQDREPDWPHARR